MHNQRAFIFAAVGAAIVLFLVAGIYIAEPAKSLPSFFPGHAAGSTHHHVKHGIAALVVGVGALVLAWFQSGPKPGSPNTT